MLAIKYRIYRPDVSVPWFSDHISKPTQDPELLLIQQSYNQWLELGNGESGWRVQIIHDKNPHVLAHIHDFGPNSTRESIDHQYTLYLARYVLKYQLWYSSLHDYASHHNWTITRSVVEI